MRRSNRSSATSMALDRARDLADLVGLDDVAFLDVLVSLDADAALVTGGDVSHVVLESSQRMQLALVNDDPIADQTNLRVTRDRPAGDVAARDDTLLGNPERGANLSLAELVFLALRRQHAGQRRLDVVDRVVDHAVEAEIDALLVGERARLLVGTDVE